MGVLMPGFDTETALQIENVVNRLHRHCRIVRVVPKQTNVAGLLAFSPKMLAQFDDFSLQERTRRVL